MSTPPSAGHTCERRAPQADRRAVDAEGSVGSAPWMRSRKRQLPARLHRRQRHAPVRQVA
eukprot:359336-Chlamydomonas_euryale.AAC.4